MNAAHDGVEQRKQGDEGDEHGTDVEREVQTIDRPSCDGPENVGLLFHRRHFHAAGGERLLGLRHEHLGHEQRSGCRHDDCG